MLCKTKGIVLHRIKYRDTSLIVKIFTEQLGLQSYIINHVRSKGKHTSAAFYYPFTLLDLVVYNKSNASLHRIKELHIAYPIHTIITNFKKSSIALFLAEVLLKVVGELKDTNLFNFLFTSIMYLENQSDTVDDFHIRFLMMLTRHIGFAPSSADDIINHIDQPIDHALYTLIGQLVHNTTYDQLLPVIEPRYQACIINAMMAYYQHHVHHAFTIKSLFVLRDLKK